MGWNTLVPMFCTLPVSVRTSWLYSPSHDTSLLESGAQRLPGRVEELDGGVWSVALSVAIGFYHVNETDVLRRRECECVCVCPSVCPPFWNATQFGTAMGTGLLSLCTRSLKRKSVDKQTHIQCGLPDATKPALTWDWLFFSGMSSVSQY